MTDPNTIYEILSRMAAGGAQLLCRPMVQNVPEMEDAVQVPCPVCGRQCWKRDAEPDPLPPNVYGTCTDCALHRQIPPGAKA